MGSHGNEIKPLGQESISRIVAEQAITDLCSVVKELVDNALDADSSTIKIRLFGHGLSIIEVSDDGTGVPPTSRPMLGTRYATSKIGRFEDIYSGTGLTMGFRGEALFSMACLSKKLIVATRTDLEEMAQKLEFRRDGSLDPDSVQSIHRKIGTTVAVVEPFAALPARRADMERRIRAERSKLYQLIQAYAIFNVGIQLNLIDMAGSKEEMALATSASSSTLEETVSSVLGHKLLTTLTRIKVDLKDVMKQSKGPDGVASNADYDDHHEVCSWEISGLVSKSPQSLAGGRAVHYFCINGRVVQLPKIANLLKKIWHGYGGKKKPTSILSFSLPNNAFDINLAPDKQQVLLTHEENICELLQETVSKLWASQTEGVFQTQSLEISSQTQEETEIQAVDDAEDSGRQMHKRRFAFVHDLAHAKMQHDLASRQVAENNEEKKQTDIDYNPVSSGIPTRQSSESYEKEPPAKRAKVVSREELDTSRREEEETSIDTQSSSRSRRTLDDRVSDLERRRWNEVQAKFKRVESDEVSPLRQQRILPVTPDDLAVTNHQSNASSEKSQASQSSPGGDRHNKNSTNGEKMGLLQRFAYNANAEKAKTVTTGTGSTANAMEAGHSISANSEARTSRPRRRHLETSESSSGNPAIPNKTEPESRAKTRILISERISKVAQNADADAETDTRTKGIEREPLHVGESARKAGTAKKSETLEPSGDDNNPPSDETKEPSPEEDKQVFWQPFENVQDVCAAARSQRIGMHWRKRELSDIERGKRRQERQHDDDDEEGANDVAQSVGESTNNTENSSPSSSLINISKTQFRNDMHVIGQFNMGFILARDNNNHLWILDQHACDEKYNFEKLCRETVLHEQKLIKPMQLDLTPAEESCILDHLQIFEANGFRFQFRPEAPVRHRLSLTALPHSGAQDGRKAVQFGKEDVSALCSILSDGCSYDAGHGGTGTDGSGKYGNNAVRRYASTTTTTTNGSSQSTQGSGNAGDNANRIIARLPKAIAMFASRACRTSIMIGTSLSKKEMDKLVKRLADVEHPWNCPHGRPTMRHVGEVLPLLRSDERRAAEHYTDPTITVTPLTQPQGEEEEEEVQLN